MTGVVRNLLFDLGAVAPKDSSGWTQFVSVSDGRVYAFPGDVDQGLAAAYPEAGVMMRGPDGAASGLSLQAAWHVEATHDAAGTSPRSWA